MPLFRIITHNITIVIFDCILLFLQNWSLQYGRPQLAVFNKVRTIIEMEDILQISTGFYPAKMNETISNVFHTYYWYYDNQMIYRYLKAYPLRTYRGMTPHLLELFDFNLTNASMDNQLHAY